MLEKLWTPNTDTVQYDEVSLLIFYLRAFKVEHLKWQVQKKCFSFSDHL